MVDKWFFYRHFSALVGFYSVFETSMLEEKA